MKLKVVIENKSRGLLQIPIIDGDIEVTFNRQGSAGKLQCNIVKGEGLDYQEGNAVAFYVDDDVFFYGYVTSKKRTSDQIIKTTCYDQLFYLKNKDILQYSNWSYSDLLKNICKKNHLLIGAIEDTKFKIPSRVENGKEYFEMLKFASDITLANTNKIYVLFDEKGKISLKSIENMKLDTVIDYDNTGDFDYQTSIEKGVYNRVYLRLLDDDKKEIAHAKAEDLSNISKWGFLNYIDTTNNELLNLDGKAKELLKLLNRKHRSLRIKNAAGDVRVRAGSLVTVNFKDIGDISINSCMLVNSVTHSFSEGCHFMDLDVINNDIAPLILPKKLGNKAKDNSGVGGDKSISSGAKVAINYMVKNIGAPYSQDVSLRLTTHFDCSSAVMRAYQEANLLPKRNYNLTTYSLINDGNFYEINKNQLKPGDICWRIDHMEMYVGDNRTIGAHSPYVPLGYSVLDARAKPFTRFFRVRGV
ncbi:hypothetical protein HMPREF9629_00611 [Peptoanaerobacter stomatis]|uniref:NlpC/P60 domain-containing protein n=1 Tax=Peptoanaerobacter stomatis TaxID=796937 RepID=G9X2K4_9FIRM|nr:NlpC/P60 family protein [Peptoanaerobacter stomatis]EHL11074.1 hypothetical protein HMPREF9629_00611 [Peptoanaerobacter stomatis]